ncbi:MAG: transcriptional regulator [Burkholderiales bacterium]|nr:MAG: transcriptional regulator [Burkholderiales bacterium]
MSGPQNLLISLEQRHSEKIFSGTKKIELRRRSMNVEPGSTVWMYVKLPVGSVVGSATVSDVIRKSPSRLWADFGEISGLSRREFYDYFSGISQGVALKLKNVQRLNAPLSLAEIRKRSPSFHPPQFFARLSEQHAILKLVANERLIHSEK